MQVQRGSWLHLDRWLLLWSLVSLAAIGVVWLYTMRIAAADDERAQRDVLSSVSAAAGAYEQYVTRSVAQMDQISMQLSQSWEQSGGKLDLHGLARSGMFLDDSFSCVAIVDASGALLSAIHSEGCPRELATSSVFLFHSGNNSSALTIGAVPGDAGSAHAAVLFSRRVERGDGAFGGVILLAVKSVFFTGFYLPGNWAGSMVAMTSWDDTLRAEQHPSAAPARATRFPSDSRLWGTSAGAQLVKAGRGFPDAQARVLGWRRSSSYPVVGLVALSLDPARAGDAARWRERQTDALVASGAIVLLALMGMLVSRRAGLRYQSREYVRRGYRAATEGANDGFYMARALRNSSAVITDFEIIDCNERGARFYGIGRAAMIGKRISTLDARIVGDNLFHLYLRAMEEGSVEDERQMPEENRLNITWGRRRIVRVGDGLAITLQDVSERRAHLAELDRVSNQDLLTGLPNRQWLSAYLPGALTQARSNVALLFIDLDDFRQVNESYGHPGGDELLKVAAQRLRSLLRPDDVLVRFGGDEFLAVLAPADSDLHSGRVAARVVEAFTAPFLLGSGVAMVGASVGISVYPRDGGDGDELVKHASVAMEAAKAEGKGKFHYYAEALTSSVRSRAQLRQSLVEAIEDDQFVLYFQPRVDTYSGQLCSMEALLRWCHPLQGMISPLEFIPLAESSGLILKIGAMVMDKACAQIVAWRDAGLPLVPVSINVSPRQFAHGQVHLQLAACLARHGVAAALLEVEITESAMMGDQEHILGQLEAIRQLGIKLHVDDFGTGYSSLSQLQKLKMDVLKVDRAFTSELDQSREGKVFFQAIVSMAHALGMAVVAEGVETAAQLEVLQQLSCNEVQGYFIARPMPAEAMAEAMQRRFLGPQGPGLSFAIAPPMDLAASALV